MRRRPENFTDSIGRLYPELHKGKDSRGNKILSKVVTFQVTDACNLACSYCYQHNKGHKVMSWETAKKFVDLILSGEKGFKNYINPINSPGIILDFIGGEPTLQIELIDRIVDYFREQALLQSNPWAVRYMTDMCSNGTTYKDPKVQQFLKKHENHISFSVSLDGDKALHDSCRVFPDGRGSYDLAEYAVKDWMSKGHYMGSKITLSPQNVMHAFTAAKHMFDLGYEEININCVFEEGWKESDGTILYQQLKKIADYMLENDLEDNYFAMFEEKFFHPKPYDDDDNWCWAAGTPVLTTNGYKAIEDIKIGDRVYTEDGSVHPVVRTTSHYAENMIKLSTPLGDFYCTDNHRIFAKQRNTDKFEKIEVRNLTKNSIVKTYIDGNFGEISGATLSSSEPKQVYNITVDTNHSYVAGGIVSSNCGGTGSMLACDPDGNLFPCIRYMDSSLNGHQPALKIGNVDDGLLQKPEEAQIIKCMDCVTRSSQSTQECMDCPIAEGCAWCSGYNYEMFGTVNHRATFICPMHKARSLGNVYFWNKYYQKHHEDKKFKMYCPKEWAVPIIGEEEYAMLKELSEE